jgi:hypothetical protein
MPVAAQASARRRHRRRSARICRKPLSSRRHADAARRERRRSVGRHAILEVNRARYHQPFNSRPSCLRASRNAFRSWSLQCLRSLGGGGRRCTQDGGGISDWCEEMSRACPTAAPRSSRMSRRISSGLPPNPVRDKKCRASSNVKPIFDCSEEPLYN